MDPNSPVHGEAVAAMELKSSQNDLDNRASITDDNNVVKNDTKTVPFSKDTASLGHKVIRGRILKTALRPDLAETKKAAER
ncbi:hypothetical protein SEUCBS140593_003480 [Sporothrix eucalyptigena]|uniref:Uncharacterized protein n=1 Tax=Sporothrix eucalyptigena TaxID=1812306 RepID=A0ABP0BF66_9PEZI